MIVRKSFWVGLGLALLHLSALQPVSAGITVIDGTISPGEWTGATTAAIGGGGTAYFKADTNFVYAAFNITGWTSAMGAASQGNLMGLGVWGANAGYGTSNGVEFQQSTTPAAWGGSAQSGTMNGLASRFAINTVSQPSIPAALEAANSFATGNRVWEVKMPISSMNLQVGDSIWAIGGINYAGKTNWYPAVNPFTNYVQIAIQAAPVPEPGTLAISACLTGMVMVARRRMARRA